MLFFCSDGFVLFNVMLMDLLCVEYRCVSQGNKLR